MIRKIKISGIFIIVLNLVCFSQNSETFVDTRDNKSYRTIKINKQTWMAENLAYKLKTDCWVYNSDTNNIDKYGYLYSFKVAQDVCPNGWHLPSNSEWDILENFLNQGRDLSKVRGALGNGAGAKLKNAKSWKLCEGYNCGNNSSGFNAMPGGFFNSPYNSFELKGRWCGWWTSTNYDNENAVIRYITYCDDELLQSNHPKVCGHGIRCLKNN